MKKIRKAVFETNSSSSHSLHIDSKTKLYETIYPDDDGVITLEGGQYGWEWEKTNNTIEKANYMATYALGSETQTDMLKELLLEHTGAKEVLITCSDDCDYDSDNYSYIDHQSARCEGGEGGNAFNSKEDLKNFIFNTNSWLFMGNDNGPVPLNYYEESLEKKFSIKIKDFDELAYSDNLEHGWELNNILSSILRNNGKIGDFGSSYSYSDSVDVDEDTKTCHIKRIHWGRNSREEELMGSFSYDIIPKGTLIIEKFL